ncbi:hypothetical protein H7X46_13225 [Pseudonocardia sp. C8]|nr:hypothetical protein [Pseudonocardia sp. C8]
MACAAALTPAVPAGAATPACDLTWGSLPETAAPMNPSPLVTTRTGQHQCWDRVVFQIAGSVGAGWDVRYVDTVVQDGSGTPLRVPGGARLAVVLHHPAYDEAGDATYLHRVGPVANVTGYRTLRSVVFGGSFEGYTTFGVGVRGRLPFRVFALPGPGGDTRIVLDVLHSWDAGR